jgi:hypothetical protein
VTRAHAVALWRQQWSGRRDYADIKMMPFFSWERARWERLRRKGPISEPHAPQFRRTITTASKTRIVP